MTASISTRTLGLLAAIFVLALVLRLAWLGATDTQLLPMSDPQYYHATASNLADGRGYSVAVDANGGGFVAGPESEGTAFWAPGYPFVLAPLYVIFGDDQDVAKIFNALAGALTVLPVFYLAWRLGREGDAERVGLLAAAILAVGPSLVYWTASLFSEPLFTLGIATTLALAAWAGERRSIAPYFVVGLALIATAFVRSQGALMVVPVAVLLVRDLDVRALVRVAAPVGAAVLLVVVPWAIRNEAVMGRPYLINSNLGYNLRIAHAPYSTGTSVVPADLWAERPGISFKERELLFDDLGRERALEYARAHPRREAELAFQRVGYLLRSDAEPAVRWSESLGLTRISGGGRGFWVLVGDLYWYPLLILTVISPLLVARTRVALAMWSALAVWVLLHTVFAGEPRYHVPVMPVMTILTAAAVVRLYALLAASEEATP